MCLLQGLSENSSVDKDAKELKKRSRRDGKEGKTEKK